MTLVETGTSPAIASNGSNISLPFSDAVENHIKQIILDLNSSSQQASVNDQRELAKFLSILRRLQRLAFTRKAKKKITIQKEILLLLEGIAIASRNINKESQFLLVRSIRHNAEIALRRLEHPVLGRVSNFFINVSARSSTAMKVLIGLSLAFPLYVFIPFELHALMGIASVSLTDSQLISEDEAARSTDVPEIYVKDFVEGSTLLVLSFIAGSTGSIISILSRLSQYNSAEYDEGDSTSFLPVFVGLFKPIIGGTFGILIFACMNTAILDSILDQPRTDYKWFTVMSVTFVVGFSERLAKDLIGKVEDKVGGADNNSQALSSEHTVSLPPEPLICRAALPVTDVNQVNTLESDSQTLLED